MASPSNSSLTDASDTWSLSSSEELIWSKAAEAFLREPTQNRQIESNISFGWHFKERKVFANTDTRAEETTFNTTKALTNTDADAEGDADGILDFISLIDSACETNETGWTHDRAVQAFDAKLARKRLQNDKNKNHDFDFFSHLDSRLREDLRRAYERRKRFGYTGDFQSSAEESSHLLFQQSMQRLARDISAAIATPSTESEGQVARRQREENTENDNQTMDELDAMFRPTPEMSSWRWIDEQDTDDA